MCLMSPCSVLLTAHAGSIDNLTDARLQQFNVTYSTVRCTYVLCTPPCSEEPPLWLTMRQIIPNEYVLKIGAI
jgi:hypothetical protein